MTLSETNHSFNFWVKYLKLISLFFAALGVMWAVIGSFDPFGIYDYYLAQCLFDLNELPADVQKSTSFILGPLGATNTAYFILQYFIAKNAFAKRELWAYHAIVFGFSFWFILDTVMCIYHQAYFNVLMANIPCLIAMLPIFFTKKYFP